MDSLQTLFDTVNACLIGIIALLMVLRYVCWSGQFVDSASEDGAKCSHVFSVFEIPGAVFPCSSLPSTKHRVRQWLIRRSRHNKPLKTLVVLGSGGHTAEMITILK